MTNRPRPSVFRVWFKTAEGAEQHVEVRADIRATDEELAALAKSHVQRAPGQRWRFARSDLIA